MLRFKPQYLLLLTFPLLCACLKYEKQGQLPRSGIVLTFDDNYIDSWYKNLPFLDSLGIQATFYISSYHSLSREKINMLRTIQAHGNEIAYHTTTHRSLEKMCKEGARKINTVLEEEILPDLNKMKADGFNPMHFAYPYGARTPALDARLLMTFKSVRGLNSGTDYSRSLVTYEGDTRVFFGLGIDGNKKPDALIDNLLKSAANNNASAFLVAHMITNDDPGPKLWVEKKRLAWLAQRAKELNLRFYRLSDLAY